MNVRRDLRRSIPVGVLALVVPFAAHAVETTWTAAADAPYWDLAANWSAGPPLAETTRALLGSFDTTLRNGSYVADTVQGGGTLTFIGGALRLAGAGSALGALDLRGGTLAGDLQVANLRWSGGGYESDAPSTQPGTLRVTGPASITGDVKGPTYSPLGPGGIHLLGQTTWEPGPSSIDTWEPLTIGASGVFTDMATTSDHRIANSYGAGFANQGRYEKLGVATTALRSLTNDGTIDLREGRLRIEGFGAGLVNRGSINVLGGRLEIDRSRSESGELRNAGTIRVVSGEMFIRIGSRFHSSGTWDIGPLGVVTMDHGWSSQPWYAVNVLFVDGAVHNDGTLRLVGSNTLADVGARVTWTGSGRIELLEGAKLTLRGHAQVGDLFIGPSFQQTDSGESFGFVDNRLELVDIDVTLENHAEVLWASGRILLQGELGVTFADLTPALGTYRLMTAEGGFGGPGGSFVGPFDGTNLDGSLYRVDLLGNGTSLDLRVAAVPEPATTALWFAGLLVVVGATRRRAAHISRCSPALSPPRIT